MNSWYPKRDIYKKEEDLQRHTYPIQNYLFNSPLHIILQKINAVAVSLKALGLLGNLKLFNNPAS